MPSPTLQTNRLILRPFSLEDAPRVKCLAGNISIAKNTANIPHPYPDGAAESWIATHEKAYAELQSVSFAITTKENVLLGSIGMELMPQHASGILGYWLGESFWGNGYCTEAAQCLLHFAIHTLKLVRIEASYFARNTASRNVLLKIGMQQEGFFKKKFFKNGIFEDVVLMAKVM